ncbi:MAG: PAS domain S-box protein, partial [Thermodesulfovibrionales bacterium]|nr:PAS domain S-box protein [Thermodesulfovibrionales bacterium]
SRDEVFWRKDGTSFPVSYVSTPIEENRRLVGAVVAFTDITEHKKTEEEIKKRVKELEEFYDMAVGRELRMKGLKEEIEELKEELGKYNKS